MAPAPAARRIGGWLWFAATDTLRENPLIIALRDSFTARNPRVTEVHVLDMRSGDYLRESASSIVLAYAVRPDHRLERTMADELFGLFLVNESMTRITETIDVIETRA